MKNEKIHIAPQQKTTENSGSGNFFSFSAKTVNTHSDNTFLGILINSNITSLVVILLGLIIIR